MIHLVGTISDELTHLSEELARLTVVDRPVGRNFRFVRRVLHYKARKSAPAGGWGGGGGGGGGVCGSGGILHQEKFGPSEIVCGAIRR